MGIAKIQLKAIEARRHEEPGKQKRIEIKHNTTMLSVKKRENEMVDVEFRYSVSYGSLGIINLEGTAIYDCKKETNLAKKWRVARDSVPSNIKVKQTITGPHMLARFSVNERPDLYPDDIALAKAYADVLIEELRQVVNEGCNYIQFDEPVWTEDVSQSKWGAEILNYIIDQFPGIKFNLHICGGNAHRKRRFFGRYTDMIEAFKILKVDEVHLEHCSLHYNMLDIFYIIYYIIYCILYITCNI